MLRAIQGSPSVPRTQPDLPGLENPWLQALRTVQADQFHPFVREHRGSQGSPAVQPRLCSPSDPAAQASPACLRVPELQQLPAVPQSPGLLCFLSSLGNLAGPELLDCPWLQVCQGTRWVPTSPSAPSLLAAQDGPALPSFPQSQSDQAGRSRRADRQLRAGQAGLVCRVIQAGPSHLHRVSHWEINILRNIHKSFVVIFCFIESQ